MVPSNSPLSLTMLLKVILFTNFIFDHQVSLFNNIKPLFANKPLFIVANKVDIKHISDLSEEDQAIFKGFEEEGITVIESSNVSEEGIMDIKNKVQSFQSFKTNDQLRACILFHIQQEHVLKCNCNKS